MEFGGKWTKLCAAIRAKNLPLAKQWVGKPNEECWEGEETRYYAAVPFKEKGKVPLKQRYVRRVVWTPLTLAITTNMDLVEVLLKNDANPNTPMTRLIGGFPKFDGYRWTETPSSIAKWTPLGLAIRQRNL